MNWVSKFWLHSALFVSVKKCTIIRIPGLHTKRQHTMNTEEFCALWVGFSVLHSRQFSLFSITTQLEPYFVGGRYFPTQEPFNTQMAVLNPVVATDAVTEICGAAALPI